MQQIGALLQKRQSLGGPASERAYWIQAAAELTGMKFRVMLGKTLHLPTNWIHNLCDDARSSGTPEGQRKRFWWLLKQTKPILKT